MEDHHKWVPRFDDGGSGVPDNDSVEDDDHWLGGGGPLLIHGEDDRAGGATGVNHNNMRHVITTTSSSTSSKTMASGQYRGLLIVAFIVKSNCMVKKILFIPRSTSTM